MSGARSMEGCPDAIILAAYIEGSLEPPTRRDVERHVANCSECPLVIGATSRFLKGTPEEPFDLDVSPASPWGYAAVVAAVLCIPIVVWQIASHRDPLRAMKRVVAQSSTRSVEGRLSGFAYAPLATPRSAASAKYNFALQSEAERLNQRGGTDAASLQARGVAQLLTGKAATAAQLLDASARLDPRNPRVWNDLAVARLEVARFHDSSSLGAALAAVDRALTLDSASASAHFNRAAILERLGRGNEAARDYLRSIVLEPGSRWNQDAAERAARLQR